MTDVQASAKRLRRLVNLADTTVIHTRIADLAADIRTVLDALATELASEGDLAVAYAQAHRVIEWARENGHKDAADCVSRLRDAMLSLRAERDSLRLELAQR